MSSNIIKKFKVNGEMVENLILNKEEQVHLCMGCAMHKFVNCQKVKDTKKRDLSEYDFITDGYEIKRSSRTKWTDGRYISEKYVVTKCKNYEKIEKNKAKQ